MIDKVDPLVRGLWSSFIGVRFSDFHFAAEEGHVAALELVAHFDREVDRPGVKATLVFGNVSTAALGLPPVTRFNIVGAAIKLHPWTSR